MNKIIISFFLFLLAFSIKAQSAEDILKLLLEKKILSQQDIDSLKSSLTLQNNDDVKNQSFTLSGQIKPRFEIRDGYGNKNIPSPQTVPAAFINQRTRLNFDYEYKNYVKVYTSIQDVRILGMYDPRGLNGSLQLFEAYVEPYINTNWQLRIGRQRIMLDSQRLFAENEWRVNASAHDGIKLSFENKKLKSLVFGAWNQSFERFYGTDFTNFSDSNSLNSLPASTQPTKIEKSWDNQWYKGLFVHNLVINLTEKLKLTTIQASDIFQEKNSFITTPSANPEKHFIRFTNGGRIEFFKDSWYATFSGYLQSGKNRIGKQIRAFYLQPEIKYTQLNNFEIRMGAEIISGDGNKQQLTNSIDGNFDALYGVAHRFNGFMDLFTNFYSGSYQNGIASVGNHIKNQGLVNPYFFVSKKLNNKWEINSQNHAFFTQYNYKNTVDTYDKYLGIETDLLLKYTPNKITDIEIGYSYVFANKNLAAIKENNPNEKFANPQWFYVQLKVTPTFFKTNF